MTKKSKRKISCKFYGKLITNPKLKAKCDKCKYSFECYMLFHKNHLKGTIAHGYL